MVFKPIMVYEWFKLSAEGMFLKVKIFFFILDSPFLVRA